MKTKISDAEYGALMQAHESHISLMLFPCARAKTFAMYGKNAVSENEYGRRVLRKILKYKEKIEETLVLSLKEWRYLEYIASETLDWGSEGVCPFFSGSVKGDSIYFSMVLNKLLEYTEWEEELNDVRDAWIILDELCSEPTVTEAVAI